LFAAKLSPISPGAMRPGRWSMDTTASIERPSAKPSSAKDQASPGRPPANATTAPPAPVPQREPPSKEDESAAHVKQEADPTLVVAIKRELAARGYASGDTSGSMQLETRAAIMAFEADHNQRLTGEASQDLLHGLLLGASPGGTADGTEPTQQAKDVIRSVQLSLRRARHPGLSVDGQVNTETTGAIRSFERSQGLKVTGRISGELVSRLERVARDPRLAAGH
jgi:peptidoglycan hydrolase-like protein with peptidoglycan-binding domain